MSILVLMSRTADETAETLPAPSYCSWCRGTPHPDCDHLGGGTTARIVQRQVEAWLRAAPSDADDIIAIVLAADLAAQ